MDQQRHAYQLAPTTYVRVPGSFRVSGAAVASRLSFTGRLARRALVAGRDRLLVILGSGATASAAFRIAQP